MGFIGAGEGIRTLDFNLGKVAEYIRAMPFLNVYITFFDRKLNVKCRVCVEQKTIPYLLNNAKKIKVYYAQAKMFSFKIY